MELEKLNNNDDNSIYYFNQYHFDSDLIFLNNKNLLAGQCLIQEIMKMNYNCAKYKKEEQNS